MYVFSRMCTEHPHQLTLDVRRRMKLYKNFNLPPRKVLSCNRLSACLVRDTRIGSSSRYLYRWITMEDTLHWHFWGQLA